MNTTFYPTGISTQVLHEVKTLLGETEEKRHDEQETLPIVLVGGCIAALGILFNIVVILAICCSNDHKKPSNWYVLNLALADLTFSIMLPFGLTDYTNVWWSFGTPVCILYYGSFYVSYYSGVFFLTVMSFDRYVAILHPISPRWRRFRANPGRSIITIFVWILALVATLPIMLRIKTNPRCGLYFYPEQNEWDESGFYENAVNSSDEMIEEMLFNISDDEIAELRASSDGDLENRPLTKTPTGYKNWLFLNFVLAFLVPLVTMMICYGCILWRVLHPRSETLQSSQKNSRGVASVNRTRSSSTTASTRKKNRVTCLVVALVAVFTVCWLPLHILNISKAQDDIDGTGENGSRILTGLFLLMAFSNSTLNPILYTFLAANFRRQLASATRRLRRRLPERHRLGSSSKRLQELGRAALFESKTTKISPDADSIDAENIQMKVMPENRQSIWIASDAEATGVNETHSLCPDS